MTTHKGIFRVNVPTGSHGLISLQCTITNRYLLYQEETGMNRAEEMIEEFKRNGGRMTLGQILKHPWGYEARARMTELRKQGYAFVLQRGSRPSENKYQMFTPQQKGQIEMDMAS